MDFGALRDRSSHDPIVARDFESLCLFFNRDKEGYSAKRMPFHSKPTAPQKQSAGIQCCKILRAVVPTVAKSWLRDADFSNVDFYFEELALIANSGNASAPLVFDTGPPGTTPFAQLVGSMLAHAPPSRV
jgi:hypothetical protein